MVHNGLSEPGEVRTRVRFMFQEFFNTLKKMRRKLKLGDVRARVRFMFQGF